MDQSWKPLNPFGERISEAIAADPIGTLLAFDFDGTLAGIEQNPEDVQMHPASADALADLGGVVGQVAIVTGRSARTVVRLGRLDSRRGLERLKVLGLYGSERWDAATGEFAEPTAPASVPAAMNDLRELLVSAEQSGRDITGIFLEDKQRAVGVHYRRSPNPLAVESWLLRPLAEVARRHGLHEEPGRMIVELRASTVTKGDALELLIAESKPQVLVMVGDDLGDLPAFEACLAARERGLTTANIVSASEEASEVQNYADIWCAGPEGVASWLAHLNRLIRVH